MSVNSQLITLDVARIRQDFPILQTRFPRRDRAADVLAYLDNAASTQKPRQVITAISRYYKSENANVHRSLHQLSEIATRQYENSRQIVAQFIGAASERQIIFTRGTTEAINLVASAWGKKFLRRGQKIVLTEMEHHSNLVPWQMLAQEKEARLAFIPFLGDGSLCLHSLDALLTDDTALLALTHASNVFGTVNPVKEIITRAHACGIPVLVDAAQSVPHFPVDVKYLDCDFLAFSGHKMCGPTGIGVLYAKEKWLQQMPPYHGGGEMISAVWLDHATYNEPPYKFEGGTPNIAGAIGLAAAVTYLQTLGMDNIAAYEQQLTSYALEKLAQLDGVSIIGSASDRLGVLSFYLPSIHPHDVAQALDSYGIAVRAGHHCAQPLLRKLGLAATVRASFYFYNSFEEIDRLAIALERTLEFFGGC